MFPTLRLILAGVSALFLVTLGALSLTNTSSERIPARAGTAAFAPRGAMISQNDHPEWRQFIVQAALRRADELAKLRELPDQPDVNAVQLRWASLPVDPQDHAPEDAVGAIGEAPPATMPMDIGETSATELPVNQNEETLPPPVKLKDAKDSRQSDATPAVNATAAKKKTVRRIVRRAKPVPTTQSSSSNPFAALFSGNTTQSSLGTQ
jgi:hypothetical protein